MATIDPDTIGSAEAMPEVENKKYKVDIYADNSNGKLEFYFTPGNEDTRKHMHGKRLEFDYGSDWYDIEYSLDDRYSTVKVQFKQSEPICVDPGTICPGKGGGINSNGQISVEDLKEKKLRIQNKNQDPPATFSYTLFFTDMEGTDVGELDPIYENGGGGRH